LDSSAAWLAVRVARRVYQPFLVHQKGLAVRGEPGAAIVGTARFEGALPAQKTSISGLSFVQRPTAGVGVEIG